MEFKIRNFNSSTGQLELEFVGIGGIFLIDVPIENGEFYTGVKLEEYIDAFKPVQEAVRQEELGLNPTGGDVLESMVEPVVVPPLTVEEQAAKDLEDFKNSRTLAVSQITVTTVSGKTFDGDEVSQNRMARAVASSDAGDTTVWVLSDNSPAIVTHEELKEALRLSGEAQTALWVA